MWRSQTEDEGIGLGKALVITEKPSVAVDISQVLGGFDEHEGYYENDDYVVTFAVGHLFELLSPAGLQMDLVLERLLIVALQTEITSSNYHVTWSVSLLWLPCPRCHLP